MTGDVAPSGTTPAAGSGARPAPSGQLSASPDSDCTEALLRVYEYLDGEMNAEDCVKIQAHLDKCTACLREYHLDEVLKSVVKRSCTSEPAPAALRLTIMHRITTIQISQG